MSVLFAPDYRVDNPYQSLLADSISQFGYGVRFLSNYQRCLPLFRGCPPSADLLHIHWPEAYFRSNKNLAQSWARALRYPIDLYLSLRNRSFVATAHNLLPHRQSPFAQRNMRLTYQKANRVICPLRNCGRTTRYAIPTRPQSTRRHSPRESCGYVSASCREESRPRFTRPRL